MKQELKLPIKYCAFLLIAFIIFSIELNIYLYFLTISPNEWLLDRIPPNLESYFQFFASSIPRTIIFLLVFWKKTLAFLISFIASIYILNFLGQKSALNKKKYFKSTILILPILIFLIVFTVVNSGKIFTFTFKLNSPLLTNATHFIEGETFDSTDHEKAKRFISKKYDYSFYYIEKLELQWGCMHDEAQNCFDIYIYDPSEQIILFGIKALDPNIFPTNENIHKKYSKSLDSYLLEIKTETPIKRNEFKGIKTYSSTVKNINKIYEYIWLESNSLKFEIYFLKNNERSKKIIESLNF